MKNIIFHVIKYLTAAILVLLSGLITLSPVSARATEARIVIVHLRGVYESSISVMPLTGAKAFKTVADASDVKNGASVYFVVPEEYLPGEFMLQFSSRNEHSDKPSVSQQNLFINNQDLEIRINPRFAGNPDSVRFQQGELENTAFVRFVKENEKKKQQLAVLHDFLMNYNAKESDFYQRGLKEFERLRVACNQSLLLAEKQDKGLFVSSVYQFNYVPNTLFTGSEPERLMAMIGHYFDGLDFCDTLMIRSTVINKWMDGYVNLHGRLAAARVSRDSLFQSAATRAIEKARGGNPLVYGWMVDYFYHGFESNHIPAGMKALEQYTRDPNCLTSKRVQIEKRLKGMKSLSVGTKAPNIILSDAEGHLFDLSKAHVPSEQILLLFYSAGCSHCSDLIKELKPWFDALQTVQRPAVVAVSLDDSEADIKSWSALITALPDWKHLRAEGINSPVANDYFLLSTPVMILLDSKTKEILALPSSLSELKSIFNK